MITFAAGITIPMEPIEVSSDDNVIKKEFTPGGNLTVVEWFSRPNDAAPWSRDSLTEIENRTIIEQNGNKASEFQEDTITTPSGITGSMTLKWEATGSAWARWSSLIHPQAAPSR